MRSFPLLLCGLAMAVPSCVPGQDTTKVLFIGNSFTYFNNMPTLFAGFAATAGVPVLTGMHAPGGVSVGDTAQGTMAHMNNPQLYALMRSNDWDVAVIQDNQGRFVLDSAVFPGQSLVVNGHLQLMDSVKANNSCAKVVLFGGWGPKNGQLPFANTGTEMIRRILRNYKVLNDTMKEVIAPVGEAWIQEVATHPNIDLWGPDQVHPSLAGSYLTAAVLFSTIFQQPVTGLAFLGGLQPFEADTLRAIASNTLATPSFLPAYNLGGMVSPPITQNGSALSVPAVHEHYQWYFNGHALAGDTNAVLAPDSVGLYSALVLDTAGCWLKSCALEVTVLGIGEAVTSNDVLIGPNPTSDVIDIRSQWRMLALEVFDVTGRRVMTMRTQGQVVQADLRSLRAGAYLLRLVGTQGEVALRRVVKE